MRGFFGANYMKCLSISVILLTISASCLKNKDNSSNGDVEAGPDSITGTTQTKRLVVGRGSYGVGAPEGSTLPSVYFSFNDSSDYQISRESSMDIDYDGAVSYTHLTLPTILRV